MFWTNIKRIFNSGWTNFFRNGFVSLSSLTIMTITLSIISSVIFFSAFFNFTLEQVKDKVDINVYFVPQITEEKIFSLKTSIESLPEVELVTYTSQEDALKIFKEKKKDDHSIIAALEELGTNPLGASLNIKARETSQYEGVAKFIDQYKTTTADGSNIIDKVNYNQNKAVIDRLGLIVDSAQEVALWVMVLFIIISIVITFNTIKLSIFISKDEISVMKLVGASHSYVRGPFIVSGLLCGVISACITVLLFIFVFLWLNKFSANYFAGFSFLYYFGSNFWWIFLSVIGSGSVLGVIASYLAVRRYLRD